MASILRSSIWRSRHAVPEKLRSSPSSAAPVPALRRRSRHSLIQVEKKKYEPPVKDWEAVPFLIPMFCISVFVAGCEAGHDHAAKMCEPHAGNLKNAIES